MFGIDVDQDRAAWIGVAWHREDGTVQVMLANDGQPLPAHRVAEEAARLSTQWGGDVASPTAFVDDLETAGARVVKTTSADFTAGSGEIYDAVKARTIRHGNQAALNNAVKTAKWRTAGADGSRAFQLKDCPEAGPLAAVTRAFHALPAEANYDPLDSVL
jgi:hypothetical protein